MMSGICNRVGVMTGLLLVASQAFAAEKTENITVNMGSVSLPLEQGGNKKIYFAQTDKELPAACAGCDLSHIRVTWKPLIPDKGGAEQPGYYLFDSGISGVLLRIEPLQKSDSETPATVTFGLVRTDDRPESAGTFQLPGPVLERTVTETDSAGRVLNTMKTTFKVEGSVTIPTCQFAQDHVSIDMPSGVSPQQLRTAGVGQPVTSVRGTTDLYLQCATQKTGDFVLSFITSGKDGTGSRLLPGNNGAGFLVSMTTEPKDAVTWNGSSVPVHSMSGTDARIPLSAWYSWAGGDITPGYVTAQGMVTLMYR